MIEPEKIHIADQPQLRGQVGVGADIDKLQPRVDEIRLTFCFRGAKIGDQTALFTHLSVPVMTRLRLPERELLDTLVRSGVARSRSHALAWCVRLVEKNESSWIGELKEALSKVGDVRSQGPLN